MTTCNRKPVIKIIRVILSLVVIILGIVYKNWLGLLGIVTLMSAFTGSCPLTINLNRRQTRS